jgi:hypothetical protein
MKESLVGNAKPDHPCKFGNIRRATTHPNTAVQGFAEYAPPISRTGRFGTNQKGGPDSDVIAQSTRLGQPGSESCGSVRWNLDLKVTSWCRRVDGINHKLNMRA